MNDISPWLELSILLPLFGALWICRLPDVTAMRRWSKVFSALTLVATLVTWVDAIHRDFAPVPSVSAYVCDRFGYVFDWKLLNVDRLSAPLLPLTALIQLLTLLATPRVIVGRRSEWVWPRIGESARLALFACQAPWGIAVLLAAGMLPLYFMLRGAGKPTRVFVLHMVLLIVLLGLGCAVYEIAGPYSALALVPLLIAVFLRSGIAPFHCWMTDLFEHASFSAALLFVAPMPGAYLAMRLVLPFAPEWVLRSIGMVSLFTALYCAGMALVQLEARRFFCYLFLSHSALVLVGMDSHNAIGLTGGLCVWLSVSLCLTGFGLTLRALEARHGRLSLARFHGLSAYTPLLATCFLLTGLASVGFPGTFGFLGTEMLVDGAVEAYPYVGIAVIMVAALNGIAVVKVYFLLFTGSEPVSSVPLGIKWNERLAVLALIALILLGGIFPQSVVDSRNHAAAEVLRQREQMPVANGLFWPIQQTRSMAGPRSLESVEASGPTSDMLK